MGYKASSVDMLALPMKSQDLESCRSLIHDINNSMMLVSLSVDQIQQSYQLAPAICEPEISDQRAAVEPRPLDILADNINQIKRMLKELSGHLPSSSKVDVALSAWDSKTLHQFLSHQIAQGYLIAPPDSYISCEGADFDRQFLCDPVLLSRIIQNLMRNSCEAFLRAPPKEQTLKIAIQLLCDQERVFIALSDNGPGISQRQRDQIFQPEFSTKQTAALYGSGLGDIGLGDIGFGLASARQAATTMNGTLHLKQSDSKGSVFVLSLPFL